MPVTAIAGGSFTVTVGATAFTSVVTGGGISHTATVQRIKTLTDVAYAVTDNMWSADLTHILDDETAGLYGALNTAMTANTPLAVVIVGGDSKWTGAAMYIDECSMTYTADGIATCSTKMSGVLVLADQP